MYELNKKNKYFDDDKVVICEATDDVFYFDLSIRLDKDDNEIPIYSLNYNKKYADDFIEFLKKRITENN